MVAADRLRQTAIWQGRYHRPVRKLIKIGLDHPRDPRVPALVEEPAGTTGNRLRSTPADDPADELRRKLAESREDEDGRRATSHPTASVAERRTEVHEQGRAALDEMKSSDEG